MLYIFDMANNHNGSVETAKAIVEQFAQLVRDEGIDAGIKFQFRDLDTFIHPRHIELHGDPKYVERFRSTRLSREQYADVIECARSSGLRIVATPFDEVSVDMCMELGVQVIKVASCSVDDWHLLRKIAETCGDLPVIMSTAGASDDTIKKAHGILHRDDLTIMHCVAEYPTPIEHANLRRIAELKIAYPRCKIGLSTHESHDDMSIAMLAAALGCVVFEKHVTAEGVARNAYSVTASDMKDVVTLVRAGTAALTGKPSNEAATLNQLRRGMWAKRDIKKGSVLTESDVSFALPIDLWVPKQLRALSYDDVIGKPCPEDITADTPLAFDADRVVARAKLLKKIVASTNVLLREANVLLGRHDVVELSAHKGFDEFMTTGAVIVNKINKGYCKKLIVMLPGQSHPTHYHNDKEEAFELLSGDCCLTLDGVSKNLLKGEMTPIDRGVKHSFSSELGCVVEEVSTTHMTGDSVYDDPDITKLDVAERKIHIKL